jgi:small subunit ribosomal protein S7
MSRRHRADKREITPDPKFKNEVVTKFMNSVMEHGKKSVAENIVYGAFDIIQSKTKQDPLAIFRNALDNVMPSIEVRSRRVGGATYQVPVEVRIDRRQALAIRWLLSARGRDCRASADPAAGAVPAARTAEAGTRRTAQTGTGTR